VIDPLLIQWLKETERKHICPFSITKSLEWIKGCLNLDEIIEGSTVYSLYLVQIDKSGSAPVAEIPFRALVCPAIGASQHFYFA